MNRAAFTAVRSPRLGLLALAVLTLLGAATAARAQGSTMEASVTGGVSGVSGDLASFALPMALLKLLVPAKMYAILLSYHTSFFR